MKIRNLKTKVIGPILLLIPMACMHMGDGHHDGGHHCLQYRQSSSKDAAGGLTVNEYMPMRVSDSEEG